MRRGPDDRVRRARPRAGRRGGRGRGRAARWARRGDGQCRRGRAGAASSAGIRRCSSARSRSTCSASTTRCAPPDRTSPIERGYALAISSLAAAVHPPLLGRLQRVEGRRRGAGRRVADRAPLLRRAGRGGVLRRARHRHDLARVRDRGGQSRSSSPSSRAWRRSRWGSTRSSAGSPSGRAGWSRRAGSAPLLPIRMLAQRFVELGSRPGLDRALEIARGETRAADDRAARALGARTLHLLLRPSDSRGGSSWVSTSKEVNRCSTDSGQPS